MAENKALQPQRGKIYWKIYGEDLRGKFTGKICGENLWESQQFKILTTNDPPVPSAQLPPEGAGGLLPWSVR